MNEFPQTTSKSKVLIFTKKVLPRSNTFVATQALALKNKVPVFLGFTKDISGIALIKGNKYCVLSEYTKFPKFFKLLFDSTAYIHPTWLKAIKKENPDIIHAHFGKGGFYCSSIAKRMNVPLVTTFHGSDVTQKDKFSYGQKHRELAFKASKKVIAVSKFIEQKLISRNCPKDKIIQHYIGIDTDYFSPLGEKAEQPTILFVGRLIEQKGCHYLLNALKAVQQKMPNAQLLIAGYGVYEATLKKLALDLNNVHFLGAQNKAQVKALMDKAWVTCLPSIVMKRGNEEGLPTVCMESQAMQTPVVAFGTGGVSEVVQHNKTGLVVDKICAQALSQSLINLLQNDELRHGLAAQARQHILTNFNARIQSQRLSQIYDQILNH